MELTQVQKDLVTLLKIYIQDMDSIIAIMLMLEKERQQIQLIQYLAQNKGKTNKSQILDKAMEIMDK